jgi:nucleoside-diphosphate-sugar epimerase
VHGEHADSPLRENAPLAPQDAYARSKVEAEETLRGIAGLRLTVLRPPLVYGPGVKANFLALMRALASGLPLPLAGIENRRSLVYIDNLCSAILACLHDRAIGRTYLVSDGAAVSTPQLCRALGDAFGRPARLFPFPGVLLPGSLRNSLEVDAGALRAELGWAPPVSFEEGLRLTAAWYRNR